MVRGPVSLLAVGMAPRVGEWCQHQGRRWRCRDAERFGVFLEAELAGFGSWWVGAGGRGGYSQGGPRRKAVFGTGQLWTRGVGDTAKALGGRVEARVVSMPPRRVELWFLRGAPCAPRVSVSALCSKPLLEQSSLSFTGGTCYSWGWNEHGMCGDGSEADIWAPKPMQALRSSLGLLVGCGAGHSLALCQLPALPELGRCPKVTGSSPDATEDAESREAMNEERNWKERQPETSTRSPSGRSRNEGLVTGAL